MRISVALCTYNGERFLRQQLASMADQDRPPDEVVVCDDGSTDETVSILEDFAANGHFPVRIHRNAQNLGSTKNFERAIGLCEGDVIATADQDDRWLPRKLAAIAEIFEKSPDVGLVFSNAELIDEDDRPIVGSLWESVRFGPGRERRMRAVSPVRSRHVPRSHAPRGNAVLAAPAASSVVPGPDPDDAGASQTAFQRGYVPNMCPDEGGPGPRTGVAQPQEADGPATRPIPRKSNTGGVAAINETRAGRAMPARGLVWLRRPDRDPGPPRRPRPMH